MTCYAIDAETDYSPDGKWTTQDMFFPGLFANDFIRTCPDDDHLLRVIRKGAKHRWKRNSYLKKTHLRFWSHVKHDMENYMHYIDSTNVISVCERSYTHDLINYFGKLLYFIFSVSSSPNSIPINLQFIFVVAVLSTPSQIHMLWVHGFDPWMLVLPSRSNRPG